MSIKKILFLVLAFLAFFAQPGHAAPTSYVQNRFPAGVIGPESLAFDCNGVGPYTGVADGRIFRFIKGVGWSEFGYTTPIRHRSMCDGSTNPEHEHICGRPLGLKFDRVTCELIVADAYHGLVKIPATGGGATTLANTAGGVPFKFLNSLAIDSVNRTVYFTDSSTNFQRKDYRKVHDTGDRTGRLMSYNLKTKRVTVLLYAIKYANGIALSRDKDYLLISEIGNSQVLRYWLKGHKAHSVEVFAKLGAAPDNISLNKDGSFWVALNNGKLAGTRSSPYEAIGVKINPGGRIVKSLYGDGLIQSVSEVKESNGKVLIGTIGMPYVGVTRAL
ncbi:hypothetical protein ACHQM5_030061 [Ranunculus cassubicifolius]